MRSLPAQVIVGVFWGFIFVVLTFAIFLPKFDIEHELIERNQARYEQGWFDNFEMRQAELLRELLAFGEGEEIFFRFNIGPHSTPWPFGPPVLAEDMTEEQKEWLKQKEKERVRGR